MKHASLPTKRRFLWIKRILLATGAILLCSAVLIALLDLLDLRVRRTIPQQYVYSFTGAALELDSIKNGSVNVIAGNAGKVTITGTLTEGIRKAQLASSWEGDTLHIRQTSCKEGITLGLYGSCVFHLTIAVPPTTTIVTQDVNTDMSVIGVDGSHHLQVSNGTVLLQHMRASSLWAATDNGEVVLGDVQTTGSVHVQTNNGKITISDAQAKSYWIGADNADITLARIQAQDSILAKTANGKVNLDHISAATLASSISNGDTTAIALQASAVTATSDNGNMSIQLTAAPSKFTAHTNNGNLTVRLPHTSTAYKTQVSSNNGKANANVKTDPDNTNNTLTATSNNGDVTVTY